MISIEKYEVKQTGKIEYTIRTFSNVCGKVVEAKRYTAYSHDEVLMALDHYFDPSTHNLYHYITCPICRAITEGNNQKPNKPDLKDYTITELLEELSKRTGLKIMVVD
jgi:hypothetical protein